MTDEEIYREMDKALTKVLREQKVFAVHETAQKLVAQAYEEAAKAQCGLCQLGLPVEFIKGNVPNFDYPVLAEVGLIDDEDIYIHRKDGKWLWVDALCRATPIYTLKHPS